MKSNQAWLEYFTRNQAVLSPIPWEKGAELSAEDKRAVARSIQEFQVGESSEGRHLLQAARIYSARTGDAAYAEAMRLFIREEQRHAWDLGRFLQLNGLPLVSTTLADRIFRRARILLPSLELAIAVLVTAEIIAQVYYATLRRATASIVLRNLCGQILRDEVSHVAFQTEQLSRLREGRGGARQAATRALQRSLFLIAITIVWFSHHGVLRRGGLRAGTWWRRCWRQFDRAFPARKAAAGQRKKPWLERSTPSQRQTGSPPPAAAKLPSLPPFAGTNL